jgi:hypothetical protein
MGLIRFVDRLVKVIRYRSDSESLHQSSKKVDGRSVAWPSSMMRESYLPPSAPSSSLRRCGASFKGGRTDLPERRMTAPLVVEHLEVVE